MVREHFEDGQKYDETPVTGDERQLEIAAQSI